MRAPRSLALDLIALTAALSAIALVVGGIIHFYQQGAFLEALSHSNDERPLNAFITQLLNVPESSTLWGIHAFGDYLQPHYWVSLESPWLDNQTTIVNYLPSLLLVHEALSLLPYRVGFGVYELAMLVCLAAPMAYAMRGRRWSIRLLGVIVLGVLAGPSIASLDRANTQGFVPILLFGFAVAVIKQRWGWATAFLVAASTVKIFPILLILVFIALRKWVPALITIVATVVLALAALPLVSSNLWPTAGLVFSNPLEFAERTFTSFMSSNVAFAGGVAHLSNAFGLTGVAEWIAAHGVLVGLLYLAAVAPLLWATRLPMWVRLIVAMALTTGVMPLAYPYALNWVIAASAVAVYAAGPRFPDASAAALPRRLSVPVLISLALVSAAYPLYWPGTMEAGIPVGLAGLAALAALVLLPTSAWAFLSRRVRPAY